MSSYSRKCMPKGSMLAQANSKRKDHAITSYVQSKKGDSYRKALEKM